jgi:hypothetical protein
LALTWTGGGEVKAVSETNPRGSISSDFIFPKVLLTIFTRLLLLSLDCWVVEAKTLIADSPGSIRLIWESLIFWDLPLCGLEGFLLEDNDLTLEEIYFGEIRIGGLRG